MISQTEILFYCHFICIFAMRKKTCVVSNISIIDPRIYFISVIVATVRRLMKSTSYESVFKLKIRKEFKVGSKIIYLTFTDGNKCDTSQLLFLFLLVNTRKFQKTNKIHQHRKLFVKRADEVFSNSS